MFNSYSKRKHLVLVQNKLSFQEIVELESVERRHVRIVHRLARGFAIQIFYENLETRVRCNGSSRDPSSCTCTVLQLLCNSPEALPLSPDSE